MQTSPIISPSLNEELEALGFLKKTLETLEEGWTFQGKKKHKVKIAIARPTIDHLSQLDALPTKVLGEMFIFFRLLIAPSHEVEN
jgi:hypothetical protein